MHQHPPPLPLPPYTHLCFLFVCLAPSRALPVILTNHTAAAHSRVLLAPSAAAAAGSVKLFLLAPAAAVAAAADDEL